MPEASSLDGDGVSRTREAFWLMRDPESLAGESKSSAFETDCPIGEVLSAVHGTSELIDGEKTAIRHC